MKKIGFLISKKNNEKRRALLPENLKDIENVEYLYFEKGYGEVLGYTDEDYISKGANVVSREEIFDLDIICDVKLGDAEYLDDLSENKILFGWAHAVQNINFTTKCINKNHTVIAWEEMYDKGRYLFYKNRELAGEAGVLQAILYCGIMPYDAKIAIIGNGKTAKGAMRVLTGLGGTVDIYDKKIEELFKEKMFEYDIIVNCVMWDTNRNDRLIYKSDLKKFKPGTLIIDISCDPNLEIETSKPTTISNPVYTIDGVIHYAVDNTPSIFYKTISKQISNVLCMYIDSTITDTYSEVMNKAVVIKNGKILDDNIKKFREKNNI